MAITGILGGMMDVQAFEQEQAQRKAQTERIGMENQALQTKIGVEKAQQDVIANFLKQGAQEQQAQQAQQGQIQRQQQAQQPPQEDRMMALGQELFNKGFTEKGAALIKEASGIKHQRFLEQKDRSMNQKQQQETIKLEAQDRGRILSGLGDSPSKDVYQAAMKQIYDDTGKVPDWYTGDYQNDKPFVDREVKSFGAGHDSRIAKMQNGQTANAYYGLVERMQNHAQKLADPMIKSMEKTALVRTLLTGKSSPAKDQQIRDALTNLTSLNRASVRMYKDNANFGNLEQRLEQGIEGWFTGKLTDPKKAQIAQMIDELDNNLYKPEFGRVEQGYREQAKRFNIPEDMVTPIDPTGFQDKPGIAPKQAAAQRGAASQGTAPPRALDYLKAHPETIKDFEAHYGFRPKGF